MKKDQLNFQGRQLPLYLGYGILDESSIRLDQDVLHAHYVFECDGSLVHQVKWSAKNCELATFCHGKSGPLSVFPDLEQALLTESSWWDLSQSDCFRFLSKEVCKQGNIFVNHPKKADKDTSVSYYPAGKMFVFSIPLKATCPAYYDLMAEFNGPHALTFYRERKGELLLCSHDFSVGVRPIIIADFIVPIAYLVSAAKRIVESGLIKKEKYFRMMVKEAYASENTFLQSFIGDKEYPFFGICFQEIEEEKYDLLADIFRTQARGLSDQQKTLAKSQKQ